MPSGSREKCKESMLWNLTPESRRCWRNLYIPIVTSGDNQSGGELFFCLQRPGKKKTGLQKWRKFSCYFFAAPNVGRITPVPQNRKFLYSPPHQPARNGRPLGSQSYWRWLINMATRTGIFKIIAQKDYLQFSSSEIRKNAYSVWTYGESCWFLYFWYDLKNKMHI